MLKSNEDKAQEEDILSELKFAEEGDLNPLLTLDKEKLFEEGTLIITYKEQKIEIPFNGADTFLKFAFKYEDKGIELGSWARAIYNLFSKE